MRPWEKKETGGFPFPSSSLTTSSALSSSLYPFATFFSASSPSSSPSPSPSLSSFPTASPSPSLASSPPPFPSSSLLFLLPLPLPHPISLPLPLHSALPSPPSPSPSPSTSPSPAQTNTRRAPRFSAADTKSQKTQPDCRGRSLCRASCHAAPSSRVTPSRLPSAVATRLLHVSKDADSTTSRANLCQGSVTLTVEKGLWDVEAEPPVFQLVPIVSCPGTGHL